MRTPLIILSMICPIDERLGHDGPERWDHDIDPSIISVNIVNIGGLGYNGPSRARGPRAQIH
ncbi:hypothetical protein M413DRAFT_441621 [Hebeloma cylindrosporum]|uniref:Uncharacterized protein n=1 Tax=Hebeloma cylindrosporum TaxID=76867 RepID=A0A0C2YZX3_HEBCY|nr:hypothetical protein M413DRAFT_441621 [Hebeloma cylindrosporum h7]